MAELAFVHTLGIVEVIGSAPDNHVRVRQKGASKERVIPSTDLQPLDCPAAKEARLRQLRSTHFRRGREQRSDGDRR